MPPRNEAERRAARWYRLRAYRILDTNAWLAGGEVDVVARRGGTVVFCEVKSKSGDGFGDPVEMVSERKAAQIRRVAEAWLAGHPECAELVVRFDVIVERGGRLECLRCGVLTAWRDSARNVECRVGRSTLGGWCSRLAPVRSFAVFGIREGTASSRVGGAVDELSHIWHGVVTDM